MSTVVRRVIALLLVFVVAALGAGAGTVSGAIVVAEGARGPAGPAGPPGPPGPSGQQGAAGAGGATGEQGPAGIAGAGGQRGATGAAGPAGPAGPAGSTPTPTPTPTSSPLPTPSPSPGVVYSTAITWDPVSGVATDSEVDFFTYTGFLEPGRYVVRWDFSVLEWTDLQDFRASIPITCAGYLRSVDRPLYEWVIRIDEPGDYGDVTAYRSTEPIEVIVTCAYNTGDRSTVFMRTSEITVSIAPI